MKLFLPVAIIASVFLVWSTDGCENTKPDKACKEKVQSVFGKKDSGMSGSLSCSGSEVSYNVKGTGYFPSYQEPEGGCVDMKGKPLRTLQDYLAGKVDYVSVAMDKAISGPRYGVEVCIPEMNKAYGKRIRFKVVDHGPSFDGRGAAKIDICTKTEKESCSDNINRKLTVYFQSDGDK